MVVKPETCQVHCDRCGQVTEHRHEHDLAWGLPNTHVVGTERYVCVICGRTLFKPEGSARGLVYNLDR